MVGIYLQAKVSVSNIFDSALVLGKTPKNQFVTV